MNFRIGFFALLFLFAMAFEISNIGEAKADVVKKSSSGICHCPGGSFYDRTARFTPYKTIDACLSSGGRHPKRGQGDCSKVAPAPGGPAITKNKARKIEGESSPGQPPDVTSISASAETWRGVVVAEERRRAVREVPSDVVCPSLTSIQFLPHLLPNRPLSPASPQTRLLAGLRLAGPSKDLARQVFMRGRTELGIRHHPGEDLLVALHSGNEEFVEHAVQI